MDGEAATPDDRLQMHALAAKIEEMSPGHKLQLYVRYVAQMPGLHADAVESWKSLILGPNPWTLDRALYMARKQWGPEVEKLSND